MSERKVLNKYYPPDFDPSKIPRIKLPKNRQYTVRLMAPFNMRCQTCGEYIYKGKKFNARKEDVENQDYLGIRIYRFYIKCTRCLQEISFKTDPKNTDYEIEAGATRNFMALKLAEEQAIREEEEAKEEEASNPMKLLENRTKQSKNEIEILELLEELKDLNKRQEAVDYEAMLAQYDTSLSKRELEEKLKQLDEDYIKTIKFQSGQKRKLVVEEEIVDEDNVEGASTSAAGTSNSSLSNEVVENTQKTVSSWTKSTPTTSSAASGLNKSLVKKKNGLLGIVKKQKTEDVKVKIENVKTNVENGEMESEDKNDIKVIKNEVKNESKSGNALSLLGAYSGSENSGSSDNDD